ncbi:hypothetical protein EV356DRAFT_499283 [Viridothelium virens]|uniref:Uncharacterized protein n=1 Tax=Viridothelium virens TaxID=1048519 RepID=A0A6A6HES8_VIRVR|nr:hypothetical protein EV356DRAFT_499283 [Viridothelium virens]
MAAALLAWIEMSISRVAITLSYIETEILGLPCWLRWISSGSGAAQQSMEATMILAIPYYALVGLPLIKYLRGEARTLTTVETFRESCCTALGFGLTLWITSMTVSLDLV